MSGYQEPMSARARSGRPAAAPGLAQPAEPSAAPTPPLLSGLAVGAADDPAERAADDLADHALARLRRWGVAPRPLEQRHRHTPGCGHLRRSTSAGGAVGVAGGVLAPAASEAIQARIGAGSRLPTQVQHRMEAGFGASLGHVRVHADADAARQSAAVSARAFTVGNDIFFGAGQFTPAEPEGEHVLSHEIAHVLADEDASVRRVHVAMIGYRSLHGEQNQDHLLASGIPVTHEDYALAATAAILLDHDYDARQMIRADNTLDDIEKQVPKTFPGLDGDDVANQIAYWYDKPPEFLTDYLRTYISEATQTRQSELTWGPMDEEGRGTSVKADFVPGGHAEGSDAGGWNAWASALARRGDAKSTLYVRGHLLNRHLGGPGLDYNLVPLTGRALAGANDANGAHSSMFEEVIKSKYLRMEESGLQRVEQLQYEVAVDPKPQGGRRGSTDLAIRISDDLLKVLQTWQQEVALTLPGLDDDPGTVAQMGDMEVDAQLDLWGWPTSEPIGPAEKRQVLALSRMSRERVAQHGKGERAETSGSGEAALGAPLKSTPEGQRLLLTLKLRPDLEAWAKLVTADRGSDLGSLSIDELRDRVLGNQELWKLEEELVPGALIVKARWFQYGKFSDFGPHTIAVHKPDDLYSPYWHSRDSFV